MYLSYYIILSLGEMSPSFQLAAMDTSGKRVHGEATDDSMNSEPGRKRLLGSLWSFTSDKY